MPEQPFKEKDVLWRWTPDQPVKCATGYTHEYLVVKEGDRSRMWFRRGEQYLKDFFAPPYVAELLRERADLRGTIREMLQRFVGTDNGYCTVCHGYRDHKRPCQNKGCPTHKWEDSLVEAQTCVVVPAGE